MTAPSVPEISRGLTQVVLGVGLSAAVYGLSGFHFRSLYTYFFRKPKQDGYHLDFAPSQIGWADRFFFIFCGVLNKAVVGMFKGGLKVRGKETVELPRIDIRCPAVMGEEEKELYAQALSGGKAPEKQGSDELGNSFLLGALTNQLMLMLVVHPNVPVSPLGAVNVRNRIEMHQHPLDLTQPFAAHAHIGGKEHLGRVLRRGVEFDIHVHITNATTNQLVLRQIITVLSPMKTGSTATSKAAIDPQPDDEFSTIGQISMSSSAPTFWARVCGDYNPIHMSSLLAKLFGFAGKIAHGNHVVAQVISLISSSAPSAASEVAGGQKGWFVDMEFKRPMVLPIRFDTKLAQPSSAAADKQWKCINVRDQKEYLSGSIGRL